MTTLTMFVQKNGQWVVALQERDTPTGRKVINKLAFEALEHHDAVKVEPREIVKNGNGRFH